MPADETSTNENLRPPPPRSEAVAVALYHERPGDRAPKVVAGGHGRVAEQILEIAFQNGVKVREDADLAELLSAIDIDADIPLEAFSAVAEILVYVYQANNTDEQPDAPGDRRRGVSQLAHDMAEKWRVHQDTGA